MAKLKETAKIKRKREEAELKSYEDEIFREYVNSLSVKSLSTDSNKMKNLYSFFKMFVNLEVESVKEIAQRVLKTYYTLGREEEMDQYVKKIDLKIKDSSLLVQKYFDEFIAENPIVTNCDIDIYDMVCDFMIDKMNDIFGDTIYFDMPSKNSKQNARFKTSFYRQLAEKGFVKSDIVPQFFIKNAEYPSCKLETDENAQKWLLDTYKQMIENFCKEFNLDVNYFAKTYSLKYSQKFVKEHIENYIKAILTFSNSLEARLTDESKKTEEYKQIRKDFSKFAQSIERVKKFNFDYVDSSVAMQPVLVALGNHESGKMREEDKKVLENFYDYVEKLCHVMNDTDEIGNKYKANYFFCTDILPNRMLYTVREVLRSNVFAGAERMKILDAFRLSLSKLTTEVDCVEREGKLDYDRVVDYFVSKGEGAYKVDLTNAENVKIFKRHIMLIMNKYELPKTSLCAHTIGHEVLKGRKNPINEKIINKYFSNKQVETKVCVLNKGK